MQSLESNVPQAGRQAGLVRVRFPRPNTDDECELDSDPAPTANAAVGSILLHNMTFQRAEETEG